MKYSFLLLLSIHIFLSGQSQQSTIKLTRPQWNKTLNKAFLSILGAKSDNSNIGNYASLDPVAGSFTFKGSAAIGKDSSTKIIYLSISINGDLISESYAALFSNSKLNTNALIQAEWHFRLRKNEFIVDKAQIGQYSYDMGLQEIKMKQGIKKNVAAKQEAEYNLRLLSFQNQILGAEIIALASKSDTIQRKVDSLFSGYIVASDADKKKWADTLVHISNNLDKLKSDDVSLQFKLDSLHLVLADWRNYSDALDAKVLAEYKAKTSGLDTALTLKKVKFDWFTLIAATGKKNYYTFFDSLSFSEQITKNNLPTWKLGISWNYYNQSLLSNQAIYMNIGLMRMKDNNTALLSTKEINEEGVIKNAVGDTVRKITQKYNAYNEPVISYKEWNVTLNFYYLYGKRTSGFHVFQALHIPDNKKTYLNAGLGYVITFINNKKDQPIINTEGYLQFNDVFNSLKIPGRFWNRNEIGLRFSLPVSLLSK